ncbi:hypothetical protein GCM10018781_53560 [Kitasatospora indigofera]|uniref:Uncharacterized protein n=1 Tax=Kitasatospora indigofera TaxID=67307 RepID=A0A919G5S8_9ACTN|nr:hypothetical protein GCM10018781_53560 [Kitasatospora indigofera]
MPPFSVEEAVTVLPWESSVPAALAVPTGTAMQRPATTAAAVRAAGARRTLEPEPAEVNLTGASPAVGGVRGMGTLSREAGAGPVERDA